MNYVMLTYVIINGICGRNHRIVVLHSNTCSQFESALFNALLNTVSAERISTTPYHSASNGLVERWHPLPAELLFGTTLRIPGEFFVHENLPGNPEKLIEKHCELMRTIRPTPTAHHIKSRIFILKDLYECSHVFLRVCDVKPPFLPPYAGPYLVKKRIDRKFVIVTDGQKKTIYVDRLKPAFIAKTDNQDDQQLQPEDIIRPHRQGDMEKPVETYERRKKNVTF
ncbi:uncharacterized protein [Chelonus insularis]|uniref:uncharacterized protein n=1 Tax=Chelonus insularis TaxID=460826 RepID=UPI00158E3D6F|nr:uncharacterized protein LOC118067671 [Chelonus insularis]